MKIKEEILNVTATAIGEQVNINKYTIDSEKPGKMVYIQGGIHGGEVTMPIVKRLFDFLKQNLKSGKVVFIPFANPLSWRQKFYFYTAGKFSFINGIDFNRVFGSNKTDIDSLVAKKVFEQVEGADFAIDLHTSRISKPYTIFSSKEYIPYLKYINIPFNFYCEPTPEYENTFDVQLYKKGIPNFVIECGSHDNINYENIDNIFNGIINLLKSFGMVDGDGIQNNNFKYYEDYKTIYLEKAGIVEFYKQVGDYIKKGEKMFSVIGGNLAEDKADFYCPENGYLLRIKNSHISEIGEEAAILIRDTDFING